MSPDGLPTSIDLSRQAPFTLGNLEVRPATLTLVDGDTIIMTERRVMQVLVALARKRGEVISRYDLNLACWGGVQVGEDALNRAISLVRRLLKRDGRFTIQTVPRVGYRLDDLDPQYASSEPKAAVTAFPLLVEGGADGGSKSANEPGLSEIDARDEILKLIGRHFCANLVSTSSHSWRAVINNIVHCAEKPFAIVDLHDAEASTRVGMLNSALLKLGVSTDLVPPNDVSSFQKSIVKLNCPLVAFLHFECVVDWPKSDRETLFRNFNFMVAQELLRILVHTRVPFVEYVALSSEYSWFRPVAVRLGVSASNGRSDIEKPKSTSI